MFHRASSSSSHEMPARAAWLPRDSAANLVRELHHAHHRYRERLVAAAGAGAIFHVDRADRLVASAAGAPASTCESGCGPGLPP